MAKRRFSMAIDGILLNRYVQAIKEQLPLKINKISQLSDSEIVFHCFNKKRVLIYTSLHAQTNRLHLMDQLDEKSNVQTNFLMLLKKYCEGAKISSIHQLGFDRVVKMTIDYRNELFEEKHVIVAIELMGKYANIILIDDQAKIIDALYRIPPYQNSKRILVPTATYVEVESLNKKSPLDYTGEVEQLLDLYEGFSPVLAREVTHRIKNGEQFDDIMHHLLTSNHLYVAQDKPTIFHAIPLNHTGLTFEKFELHQGLNQVYKALDHKKRVKDVTSDLEKIIRRELKKAVSKKEKLEKALSSTTDAHIFKEYGDYCFTYASQIPKGAVEVTLDSFDQENQITIPLDPKLNAIQNGQLFYKKYQKQVSSVPHITNQIEIAQQKIDYFSQLEDQLSYCDVADALEIKEELTKSGYFYQQKQRKQQKKQKPSYMEIKFDEHTTIYVGKNNIQNDYVTFTCARKKDTWFHTRHHHGAHVVISSEYTLSESHIRAGAMLAAYYSKARHSSSVEVMIASVSQIKKIPQAPKGKVAVGQYQSIFIDPDESIIKAILARKY
jgi:predicted ribosome quality control (RQC) complex YloA/Tae2 family protein